MATEENKKGAGQGNNPNDNQTGQNNNPNNANPTGNPNETGKGNNPNDESQKDKLKEVKSEKDDKAQTSKEKFSKEAESIFKDYPKTKVLYFTSDGLPFFEKTDAQNHAYSLKENEREIVKVEKSTKK